MSLPIGTAVTGATWEAELVAGLERDIATVTVVRRCVDVADLLATAASGMVRAVLVSSELRKLDRHAVARLAAAGVVIVGLVSPGDEIGEQRLRQLGLGRVLPADSPTDTIADAVADAVRVGPECSAATSALEVSQPSAGLEDLRDVGGLGGTAGVAEDPARSATVGRLVAVWGPTGAPGRSSVALTIASELAGLGEPTLLADADVYGGVLAMLLGLLDESPGLAAAARLANHGALDLAALARVAPIVSGNLRVLTGISRADRWPELRPAALETVWVLARRLAAATVVDCGFALEQDEEISFDTAAPRRNGATLLTLDRADTVVAVTAADPVGVQRLVRGLAELRAAVPSAHVIVVVNKVRRSPVGSAPERQLAEALERYAGVRDPVFVPYDREAFDAALLHGRPLTEVAPRSPARQALAELAGHLAGRPAVRPSGRRRSRRH